MLALTQYSPGLCICKAREACGQTARTSNRAGGRPGPAALQPSGGGPKVSNRPEYLQSLVPRKQPLNRKNKSLVSQPQEAGALAVLNSTVAQGQPLNIHEEAGKPTQDCTQSRQGGDMHLREGPLLQKPATVSPVAPPVCAPTMEYGVGGACTQPTNRGHWALSLYTFPTNSIWTHLRGPAPRENGETALKSGVCFHKQQLVCPGKRDSDSPSEWSGNSVHGRWAQKSHTFPPG